ncbi:MAG: hypothetical protein U0350_15370 [Caldilineaceae bacterium]
MKRFFNFSLLVALLIVTACAPVTPVKAHSLTQVTCTQATFQGSYAFLAPATVVVNQGTVIAVPEAYLATSPAAYASQGMVTFDGQGHVTLQATAGQHGKLAASMTYTGTYAANGDCTAKVTMANHAMFAVHIIQAGERQQLVSLTPGFVVMTHR